MKVKIVEKEVNVRLLKDVFKNKAQTKVSAIPKRVDSKSPVESVLDQLVKGVKNPNEVIKKELINLVEKSSKENHPDLKSLLGDAKILLGELLKNVPSPDMNLIDQFLTMLVVPITTAGVEKSQKEFDEKMDALDVSGEQNSNQSNLTSSTKHLKSIIVDFENDVSDAESSSDSFVSKNGDSSTQSGSSNVSTIDNPNKSRTKPTEADAKKISESQEVMIGLMMNELKVILAMTTKASADFKANESKLQSSLDVLKGEQKLLKAEVGSMKEDLKSLESNIEKFIGLYEVVSNMYNPFVEDKNSFAGTKIEPAPVFKESQETNETDTDINVSQDNVFDREYANQKKILPKDIS